VAVDQKDHPDAVVRQTSSFQRTEPGHHPSHHHRFLATKDFVVQMTANLEVQGHRVEGSLVVEPPFLLE